tara:strand:- start:85 stop:399 length:315 start_codon:yes stop_codon:yes gene_type:complete
MKKYVDGILVDMSEEDIAQKQLIENESNSKEKKLAQIRKIRLEKLQETDYMANSDYTMPINIKTWRQTMRDIPSAYTTLKEYNEILNRDEDGNLTHSVWKITNE